jgi:hypothetical protein
MGFCHIADDAKQYEALLTSRFNELQFTEEMRERVDFYILYDRAIGRIESTQIPYWGYGSVGGGSIWSELTQRILYNIHELDPAALAIKQMMDSGAGRTINPRFRDLSPATGDSPAIALPPPAVYTLGHALSFGRDGDGGTFQLSSNTEIEAQGRWFPVDRDALIGLALAGSSRLDPVKPIVLRMQVFSKADGHLNVCVNGQPLPRAAVTGGGCLVERSIEASLIRGAAIVVEVSLLDANEQRLPFRIDTLAIDQPSNSAGRADKDERPGRLSVVSRKTRMNGLLAGSYPVEGSAESEYIWVRGKAHMLLRPTSKQCVQIAGYIPFSMHKARNGVADFTMTAKAGGSMLNQIRVSEDQVFEFDIDIARLPRRADGLLRIDFEASSELAATAEDQRELSYIVTKIAVE